MGVFRPSIEAVVIASLQQHERLVLRTVDLSHRGLTPMEALNVKIVRQTATVTIHSGGTSGPTTAEQ